MRSVSRRATLGVAAFAAVVAAMAPAPAALALPPPSAALAAQRQTLTADDGGSGDYFGSSVAVSGDTMVVGALSGAKENQLYVGAAYVYVRSAAGWTMQAKLTASDASTYADFGEAVAIDGDTIAVGAVGSAEAYVFVRNGTEWTQQASASGPESFGWSVAVDGDTLVVGAPLVTVDGQTKAGTAFVYHRDGTQWTRQTKLRSTPAVHGAGLGVSVSVDGDTVFTGTNDQLCCVAVPPAAYVFTWGAGGWTQQQKFVPSEGGPSGSFGFAVDVDGDTAIVGAPGGTGGAYVYTRAAGTWTQQAILTYPQSGDHDYFGGAVAVDGDAALIGASYASSDSATDAGAAYLFRRSGAWSLSARTTSPDGATLAKYGESVDLDATAGVAVVGAPFHDTPNGGLEAGSAYVYFRR